MMRNSIFKSITMLATVALFVACSGNDDDNPTVATCNDGIQNGSETGVDCGGSCTPCMTMSTELSGDITSDETLDASIEYTLTGAYVVKSGSSLTIPAGTVIKAAGGTAAFIGVERGATINVNGTAANPVVMTSGNATPAPGDWGGLVIAGDAPTNKGTDVTTEVGDLTYGGSNAADSSGSIRYLRVEYTGATFSNDKEFNGVSLFGVGSGTTFEFVQSFNGGDDGIEFFGGAVSGNNLVSIGSGDDSIDYADGWTGSGNNWYIAGGAKAGIEGSNNGDDGNATPVTTTSLSNITVVGPTNDEGAFFFKEGGGNVTIDNFYISNAAFGITVESSDAPAIARIDGGDLTITNIQFADTPDGFEATTYTGSATFFTEGVATGAGNGASAPSWASGWTRGLSNSTATSENLAGEVTGDVELDSNIEYLLTSGFVVKSGGSLTIPAGTTIKASGGTAAFIGVERGAQIFINGTASEPVVMTSDNATPAPGDWGGLVIAGDAPTNKGVDVTTEVGDLTYGGTTADDNSGSIRYLRVEYTGATFSNDKEFNGVSLFGVGSGTTFEFVQSLNGGDDGIEFFGGAVSGNNLVSIGSGDDSIDYADGWTGSGSNWYIKGGAKAGIEGSNNGDDGNATPVTTTTLSNITVVGPTNDEGAFFFKEGGGNVTIDNFYISNAAFGITVESSDAPAIARIDNGDLTITNIQFADEPMGFEKTTYTGAAMFFTEGTATGAGNGADAPDWASGWTAGL